jgi:hypothetical protein
MHAVLTWDNNVPEAQRQNAEQLLLSALQQYSWVRPLKSTVIVNLPDEVARTALRDALIAQSKTFNSQIIFIISPLMLGGQYNGYLPMDSWPKLADLSKK